jgi:hypothetical protein
VTTQQEPLRVFPTAHFPWRCHGDTTKVMPAIQHR